MGVQGLSVRGYGVRGRSSSNVGVRGDSTDSNGVFATSTNGTGLFATSTNGIAIQASAPSYLGVYAAASTYGLYGTTSAGYGGVGVGSIGFYGSGTNVGLYGVTSTGNGVIASAGAGRGVYSTSTSNRAFEGHVQSGAAGLYVTNANGNAADITGSYIGLVARSNTFPLLLTDASGNDLFYVDGAGNLFYHGTLNHFASPASASTTQSAPPSKVQESGTGRLVFGQANIALSASFARSIDMRYGYQVIITPGADTRGLFVVSKTPYAFAVREMQNGRGNLNFDYVVYATTSGQSAVAASQNSGPRAMPIVPAPAPAVAEPKAPRIPQRP
jgi:hypothetical protein